MLVLMSITSWKCHRYISTRQMVSEGRFRWQAVQNFPWTNLHRKVPCACPSRCHGSAGSVDHWKRNCSRIIRIRSQILSVGIDFWGRVLRKCQQASSPSLCVYVIAWARGQLRIYFASIFKVFTKLPESRSDEGSLENFENTSEINP